MEIFKFSQMITDFETNFLWLADSLPKKSPNFYKRLEKLLIENKVEFNLLPGTKDIWAVDYMPIQICKDKLIQFIYHPDYLQSKKWQKTISDTDAICKSINVKPNKSEIIVDGGNVIRTSDKVIMCEKVFIENPRYKRKELIAMLESLFEVDEIIFIPTYPKDEFGHADGIIRIIDNKTVLINKSSPKDSKHEIEFGKLLRSILRKKNISYHELAYNPFNNKSDIQANGTYINYLQMKGIVFVPIYGMKEDEIAVKAMEEFFAGSKIESIDCNEIANEGGVLNCISWNILK